MLLIETVRALEAWKREAGRKGRSLGFVPTMGALHEGHLSLIRRAKEENDLVVASVFVNPTQFGPGEDFERYPRSLERDCDLASGAGADVVFHPDAREIYGEGHSTIVRVEGELAGVLCGKARPGHFQGVTTVVNILFNIVGPDRAYFGQKDAQQSLVVQKMVRDLKIPVEVRVCPILREEDGLAMSSRNAYLQQEERRQAVRLHKGLEKAGEAFGAGERNPERLLELAKEEIRKAPLGELEYLELLDGRDLRPVERAAAGDLMAVAVRFGKTRLIDNILLEGEMERRTPCC
ncbi:pantoate--beta-alanine ligase [Anaerotalea alkaliphila]|uniref:Pantothenate synthetase n=1 Tax=Anaerotalea alkaliphila TaxID=2662126 RepID=A0A7X5KM06_9FIRM|nr:pantoate--beta-alanine ligase [Anaerotalea alkaliphila]NDL66228.1 pantoate--beta-alanine ligase [Anaerotalea alkaliphila]